MCSGGGVLYMLLPFLACYESWGGREVSCGASRGGGDLGAEFS